MSFPPLTADVGFSRVIQQFQPDWLTAGMKGISALVHPEYIAIISFFIVIYLHWRKHDDRLIAHIFFLGAGHLWIPVLKETIARPRPSPELAQVLVLEPGFSFPSGHALSIVLIGGIVALLVRRLAHQHRQAWLGLITIFIFLVGYSRIYLGVHWLSDVVAGFVVGLLWVILALQIRLPLHGRARKEVSR